MAENAGGVKFINCVGSDIHIWKKKCTCQSDTFDWETCILFDEPEYHLESPSEINTSWKFYDHITKRYLLGNDEKVFHYQKYQSPPLNVNIITPLYTLKELCTYTIATRLLVNDAAMAIDDLELPKQLKDDLKSCLENLSELHEQDDEDGMYDWTVAHEERF